MLQVTKCIALVWTLDHETAWWGSSFGPTEKQFKLGSYCCGQKRNPSFLVMLYIS